MNRSIQVEGAFGVIKQDYAYKRIHRRGKENVYKELLVLAFGFNLRKLHSRMMNDRLFQRLFTLKKLTPKQKILIEKGLFKCDLKLDNKKNKDSLLEYY